RHHVRHHHRHGPGRHDGLHRESQHLLRHDRRRLDDDEHDRAAGPGVLARGSTCCERATFRSQTDPFRHTPSGRSPGIIERPGVAANLLRPCTPAISFVLSGARTVFRVLFKGMGVCANVAALVVFWSVPGEAQSRRGGPTDWSHARIVAARFGPDGDRNVGRDWRSARKQMQLLWAQQSREASQDLSGRGRKPAPDADAHLDWSLRTGGYGNVVGSPAKYSFDVSTYDCSDVVYFTVDQAGSASAGNGIAITNAHAACT